VAGEHRYAISVDVGGTFTDFVLFDMDAGSTVAFHKVLTDAERPARAVIQGWTELLEIGGVTSGQVEHAVHSTTLVTNAIVERRGANTALLTTQGFRDVLEIGIEQIYDIYDLFAPYPEPLIPRKFRIEIPERINRDGQVIEPLDEEDDADNRAGKEQRDEEASQLVDRFSLWSGAAGLIPIPLVDMATVAGVQLQMLRTRMDLPLDHRQHIRQPRPKLRTLLPHRVLRPRMLRRTLVASPQ
jgi:hypothetical protein